TTNPAARELVRRYQKRPYEELYDRVNDPDEHHNLADAPKYAKIKKQLSKKLDAWMEREGDKGNETEMEAFEHQNSGQKGAQKAFLTSRPEDPRILLADPFIFEDKGIYYIYGTCAPDGILCYRSLDLEHWEGPVGKVQGVKTKGLALSSKHSWGDHSFWAPEVYKLKNGRYAMVYSVQTRIAIAFSDSPMGPFKPEGDELFTPDQNSIDNHIFVDDDGQAYIYWVRFGLGKGNEIRVAKLSDDFKTIVSEQFECLHSEEPWERQMGKVTEGPFVLKHEGTYYLTYSANDFHSKDYAVGYATSSSPLGPWKKYEGNPILHNADGNVGCGHHAFFRTYDGELYVVFHAHNSDEKITPRQTLIAPAGFEETASGPDKLVVNSEDLIYPIFY
ncbi:MAG: family 43 glycosylhydrolase, partial [Bacteroidales bacterium]|nr:family 43 glycosylhydrolase [Bacteroidales bacterium]